MNRESLIKLIVGNVKFTKALIRFDSTMNTGAINLEDTDSAASLTVMYALASKGAIQVRVELLMAGKTMYSKATTLLTDKDSSQLLLELAMRGLKKAPSQRGVFICEAVEHLSSNDSNYIISVYDRMVRIDVQTNNYKGTLELLSHDYTFNQFKTKKGLLDRQAVYKNLIRG